jgi:hypothetical protein
VDYPVEGNTAEEVLEKARQVVSNRMEAVEVLGEEYAND